MLVLVERRHRRGGTLEGVLPPDCAIAAITVTELQLGVLRAISDVQRERSAVFLASVLSRLAVVGFGIDEALAYAAIHDELRRRGELIGDRDLQIGATAVAKGHAVMTGNHREFGRIPRLQLIEIPLVLRTPQ